MSNPDTTRQLPIPAPHMLDMDSKPQSPYRVIRPEDAESLRTTRSPSAGQLDPMITATGLVKSYRKHKTAVPVLKGVDFVAPKGRVTAITPAGCFTKVAWFIPMQPCMRRPMKSPSGPRPRRLMVCSACNCPSPKLLCGPIVNALSSFILARKSCQVWRCVRSLGIIISIFTDNFN